MCGIVVILAGIITSSKTLPIEKHVGPDAQHPSAGDFCNVLRRRGPDRSGSTEVTLGGSASLHLASSLLQLRGNSASATPHVSLNGSVLLFNGEVFGGLHVPAGSNDAESLLAELTQLPALTPGTPTPSAPSSDRPPPPRVAALHQLSTTCDSLLESEPTVGTDHPAPSGEAVILNNANLEQRRSGDSSSPLSTSPAQGAVATGVPELLSRLRGPWALAYYDAARRRLWFGRDAIGRRSLLVHWPNVTDGRFLLASASVSGECAGYWQELPPGLYSITFEEESKSPSECAAQQRSAERSASVGGASESRTAEPLQNPLLYPAMNPTDIALASLQMGDHQVPAERWVQIQQLEGKLRQHSWTDPVLLRLRSGRRCGDIPGPESNLIPSDEPFDQLIRRPANQSVRQCADQRAGQHRQSSATTAAIDQTQSASLPAHSLEHSIPDLSISKDDRSSHPHQNQTLPGGEYGSHAPPKSDALGNESSSGRCSAAVTEAAFEAAVRDVSAAMQESVRVRCHCIDSRPQPAPPPAEVHSSPVNISKGTAMPTLLSTGRGIDKGSVESQSKGIEQDIGSSASEGIAQLQLRPSPVLVLLSGGVDSTLIAALAHGVLPKGVPIDLASVCFDGGRSPDRLAARDALEELHEYAPCRDWRMIEVDKTLSDVDTARDQLLQLLAPAGTVMDLNIGAALWFAVEAVGKLRLPADTTLSHLDGQQYTSQARVVLLGHGADELCAGYGRHRNSFLKEGWPGLSAELSAEVERMWLRNLGRDDRLIADRSREARHPFLDETVVDLIQGTPLPLIADFDLPPGEGDKRILRAVLRSLGLPRAAARVKRAIQFGSRIGNLVNKRDFGNNRAARGAGSSALRSPIEL